MIKHGNMTDEELRDMLANEPVGRLATVSLDGRPYVVPVHFACDGSRLYFHSGYEGVKMDNIRHNPEVCFEVDEIQGMFVNEERPCNSTTYRRSIIAFGSASVVEDRARKLYALGLIMRKHSKENGTAKMPVTAVDGTCIVEITITEISGKKKVK